MNHFLSHKLNYQKEYVGYSIAILTIRFLYFLREGNIKKLNKTIPGCDKLDARRLRYGVSFVKEDNHGGSEHSKY